MWTLGIVMLVFFPSVAVSCIPAFFCLAHVFCKTCIIGFDLGCLGSIGPFSNLYLLQKFFHFNFTFLCDLRKKFIETCSLDTSLSSQRKNDTRKLLCFALCKVEVLQAFFTKWNSLWASTNACYVFSETLCESENAFVL